VTARTDAVSGFSSSANVTRNRPTAEVRVHRGRGEPPGRHVLQRALPPGQQCGRHVSRGGAPVEVAEVRVRQVSAS
jgi:hypothetical protein